MVRVNWVVSPQAVKARDEASPNAAMTTVILFVALMYFPCFCGGCLTAGCRM
jgi:hypothetical protein